MGSSHIESGIQLFSRVTRKNFLEGINSHFFPHGGPFPNQIIEITGNKRIDKSDLLIDFLVKCILPNEYKSEWKSSEAVLIICEHQINILKIIKVVETHLKNNNVLDAKKEILENALKNLTIFNCYSPEDLELAIMYLERLILVKENINLVVIDNITAYYWIAKQESNLSYYQHALNIFQKVFNVIKTLNILLLYVRYDKSDIVNKKGFHNLDYRIDIQDDENKKGYFKSVITNFENQNTTNVNFKTNIVLEF